MRPQGHAENFLKKGAHEVQLKHFHRYCENLNESLL